MENTLQLNSFNAKATAYQRHNHRENKAIQTHTKEKKQGRGRVKRTFLNKNSEKINFQVVLDVQ